MRHLVFLPRAAGGPSFFLWASESGRDGAGLVDRLAALGRHASARLVAHHLTVEPVTGLAIPLLEGVGMLAGLDAAELDRVPASIAGWSLAAKLALDLISRERVLPVPRPCQGGAEVRWGVALSLPDDGDRFARLARALPPAAHAVPRDGAAAAARHRREPSRPEKGEAEVWAPEALLTDFLDATADALIRHQAAARRPGMPTDGATRWEARFVGSLTGAEADARFLTDQFVDRALLDELSSWIAPVRGATAAQDPRVCFKLDPPNEGGRSQAARAGQWTLAYFLQAPDDPSLLLPPDQIWATPGKHLRWMDRIFEAPQEVLLRALAQASRLFTPIERSLHRPRPEAAALNTAEAWRFLAEGAAHLSAAGFTVRIPAALTPAGQRRLRLRLRVGGGSKGSTASGVTGDGRLSLDALIGYRWQAALGDQPLSAEEFQTLAALKRPLVQWRGEWVVLHPDEITEVRRLLNGARGGRLTARDVLVAALAEPGPREGLPVPVEVVPEGQLAAIIGRLRSEPDPVAPPADLVGTLRPYQERGLAWLSLMAKLGLGGCLADDMGLGKTVQAIAFLLVRRALGPDDSRPVLIVCPTSVVGNWERELARFAPTLPVLRHHGPDRARSASALHKAPPQAVVVTTYSLLRRDQAPLGEVDWAVVILDEAQNIKNAAARQATAARALRATHRFALTGTPVENRLAELWSILEFCIPGLLGPLEQFRRRFAIPVERYRDDRAAAELRQLVRPFVLRRLKGDPGIVADLPPKQEMAVVCTLTREQATLYQAAVDDAMATIKTSEGIQRRGLVLALLTGLKQICNHPAHYLREAGPLPGRSGKLDRLTEMLEETVAAGDRALVFTQFREMGARLVRHLERTLDVEIPFLHGGVPRAARDAMIDRFQEEGVALPIFVLSLRAGGTGLNLTRATRVFHFDRWWNPAVEDQATDRAHRIGQERLVQVYRLLTAGTLEEKIDAMLADKRALADRIIGPGEAWITELSDSELSQLLTLSGDAVVESDDDSELTGAGAHKGSDGARRRRG